MADCGWTMVVCGLRPEGVGDGGHDLRSQPYLPSGMVYRGVVRDQPEVWGECARTTAMVRPGRDRLRGSVEADETYVGGVEEGVHGRETHEKSIVVMAVEVLPPKGFGRVRMRRIPDVSGDSLIPFVCDAVEPGAVVRTDGWSGYHDLPKHGYTRKKVILSNTGDPAHVSMPAVHQVASLLNALAARHAPGCSQRPAPRLLFGRVHLSLQSPHIRIARPAVAATDAASRRSQPRPCQENPRRPAALGKSTN